MYTYNQSPLEEVSTEWLRANLRFAFDQVNFRDVRYEVLRRGRPVAGIVRITEARALFEATRADRQFRDVHLRHRLESEERLREAMQETAETLAGLRVPVGG